MLLPALIVVSQSGGSLAACGLPHQHPPNCGRQITCPRRLNRRRRLLWFPRITRPGLAPSKSATRPRRKNPGNIGAKTNADTLLRRCVRVSNRGRRICHNSCWGWKHDDFCMIICDKCPNDHTKTSCFKDFTCHTLEMARWLVLWRYFWRVEDLG